jgi:hypothetical protein
MYILLGILALFLLVIAGVVIAGSMQPTDIHYQRSITTSARAETAFAIFSDLARWDEWSPYNKKDPSLKKEISSPSTGVGARYTWEGNKDIGAGRMTITAIDPHRSVDMRLEFDRPFKCDNHVEWRVDEEEGQRRITWSMDGKEAPLMPRIVGLFIDMDKMIGKDWEEGLETLKGIAEQEEAAR